MNEIHVYRLVGDFPAEPNWEEWEKDNPHLSRTSFRWPRRRNFLSPPSAYRLAQDMKRWGASVEIVRSAPVAFPDPSDVAALCSRRREAEDAAVIVGLRELISSLENEA